MILVCKIKIPFLKEINIKMSRLKMIVNGIYFNINSIVRCSMDFVGMQVLIIKKKSCKRHIAICTKDVKSDILIVHVIR